MKTVSDTRFLILIVTLPLSFVSSTNAKALEGSRPNIVFVLTDDNGMGDLACLGNPVLQTPHLDSFYDRSVRFTDFHMSPTCAPSRAAVLSGRHEFKNGVTHTIYERERMALSTTTFPTLLQNAGYQTGIWGKWHLGDEEAYLPQNRGFNEVFIHGCGGIGQTGQPGEGTPAGDFEMNRKARYFDNVILHNGKVVQTTGFCTDVFFQAALGWIKNQLEADQPFFAMIAPNAPHGPMIAPEKYKKRFLEDGWSEDVAGRYGMIENIDDNFGLLMQKLEEWDALENTLVIHMTDNGQAGGKKNLKDGKKVQLYAPFKTGKGSVFEGGTHVPSFWAWKGVFKEGTDVPALAAHIDLFKTFCDLAGAEIPKNMQSIDGKSLVPLLENPKAAWPDRMLFTHRGRWAQGSDPDKAKYLDGAVRTQQWRLIFPRKGKTGAPELYDISTDPFEKNDVADQHPEVIEELTQAYDAWWQEVRPLMVNETMPESDTENAFEDRYQAQLKAGGIPNWNPIKF
jgi:arylsulfatase